VNIKTCENEGTTFELYFPATREDIVGKIALPKPIEYLGRGEHILVVDDMAEQRALVRALLQELGYTSTEVASGQEALDFLKENRADLVVLDMIMEDPEMDGLETFKHIVRFNSRQKALIASGYAETDRVKTALELGAAKYLKKPYTLEVIGMTIHQILRDTTEPY
jgi:CheY-like chemotaxis protein